MIGGVLARSAAAEGVQTRSVTGAMQATICSVTLAHAEAASTAHGLVETARCRLAHERTRLCTARSSSARRCSSPARTAAKCVRISCSSAEMRCASPIRREGGGEKVSGKLSRKKKCNLQEVNTCTSPAQIHSQGREDHGAWKGCPSSTWMSCSHSRRCACALRTSASSPAWVDPVCRDLASAAAHRWRERSALAGARLTARVVAGCHDGHARRVRGRRTAESLGVVRRAGITCSRCGISAGAAPRAV